MTVPEKVCPLRNSAHDEKNNMTGLISTLLQSARSVCLLGSKQKSKRIIWRDVFDIDTPEERTSTFLGVTSNSR